VKGKIREKSAIGGDILGAAVPAMVVWRYMVFDSRSCEVSEDRYLHEKPGQYAQIKGITPGLCIF
jgi:hypothetical protein